MINTEVKAVNVSQGTITQNNSGSVSKEGRTCEDQAILCVGSKSGHSSLDGGFAPQVPLIQLLSLLVRMGLPLGSAENERGRPSQTRCRCSTENRLHSLQRSFERWQPGRGSRRIHKEYQVNASFAEMILRGAKTT